MVSTKVCGLTKKLQTLMNKGLQRCLLASMRGFEPPTPRLGGVCSIQLSYMDIYQNIKFMQDLDSNHLPLRRRTLYPTELRRQYSDEQWVFLSKSSIQLNTLHIILSNPSRNVKQNASKNHPKIEIKTQTTQSQKIQTFQLLLNSNPSQLWA